MLRIALGIIFIGFGWTALSVHKQTKAAFFETLNLKPGTFFVWFLSTLEMLAGIFLVAGFMTQPAAMFAALVAVGALIFNKKRPDIFPESFNFLCLLLLIALSLIITGPGAWAIDLPL
ncbi:MAG: DoxX family protein [Candidatus Taylorbacteria bacterium]|nr:DoxX family protein [Candidatus Taylorbacteria bacterium]